MLAQQVQVVRCVCAVGKTHQSTAAEKAAHAQGKSFFLCGSGKCGIDLSRPLALVVNQEWIDAHADNRPIQSCDVE